MDSSFFCILALSVRLVPDQPKQRRSRGRYVPQNGQSLRFGRSEPKTTVSPSRLGARETFRIYAMLVVLVLVLSAMGALYWLSRENDSVAGTDPSIRPRTDRSPLLHERLRKPPVPAPGPIEDAAPPQKTEPSPQPKIPAEQAPPTPPGASDDLGKAVHSIASEHQDLEIQKDTPAFLFLLTHFLEDLTPEDASSRVDPAVAPAALFDDPERHAGRFVRMRGRLIQLYPEWIQATTSTNTDIVYRGFLQASHPPDPGRTIEFFLPALPVDPATGKKIEFEVYRAKGHEFILNEAIVEGVFLRLHHYETQNPDPKKAWTTSALLLAKNLRVVPRPQPPPEDHTGGIILVGIALGLGILLFLVARFMRRRYGRGTIHLRLHAARRTQGRQPPPSAGGAPEGDVLGEEVPE